MALLQDDKSVFYHPLDDATESLKAQAWALLPGDLTGAGQVSKALSGTAGTAILPFGPAAPATPGTAARVNIAGLSATAFAVVYADSSNGNRGTVVIGTVSGSDITFGTATVFSAAAATTSLTASGLSSTLAVVAWVDDPTGDMRSMAVAVSGSTATLGPEITVSASNNQGAVVTSLSATSAIVMWRDNTATVGRALVLTASGVLLTAGPVTDFSLSSDALPGGAAALSATLVVITWQDVTTANIARVSIGTVTGTSVSFGAPTTLLGVSMLSSIMPVAAISATSFIATYQEPGVPSRGKAKVGIVSGTAITLGAEIVFTTGTTVLRSVVAMGAGLFAVSYLGITIGPVDAQRVVAGRVSGLSASFGSPLTFFPGSSNTNDIAILDGASFAAVYDSPGSPAAATVGSLGFDASLSGSGAAYASASGATKVGFVGWLKKPSA